MPEHTTFITYLLSKFPALAQNADAIGYSFIGHHDPTWRAFEPIFTSILVILLVTVLALRTRATLADVDRSVIPDDTLTLRTVMEATVQAFATMAHAKDLELTCAVPATRSSTWCGTPPARTCSTCSCG